MGDWLRIGEKFGIEKGEIGNVELGKVAVGDEGKRNGV
jgi:hypothetical protein